MTAPERVVLLKSWSAKDDISVIKEVATNGEYVDLCMAYLARKKQIPIEKSRKYFHHIVDNYVNRLINDKLVFKAEDVLHNVSRDWKSIYYQYAFDSKISTLRDLILNHIQKKDQEKFNQELHEYEFYWRILKEIQKYSTLNNEIQNELEILNLEALYQKDDNYRKLLIVRLYFENKDAQLLEKIDKKILWNFLILQKLYTELIKWCYLSQKTEENNQTAGANNNNNISVILPMIGLNNFYRKHQIEYDMYEAASSVIFENVPEILRNFFITKGCVFIDERDNVKILQRVFTTECYYKEKSKKLLDEIINYKFLLENNAYNILIDENYILPETLDQLKLEFPNKDKEISLLIKLNQETISNQESFIHLLIFVENYIKSVDINNKDSDNDNKDSNFPIITLLKYILNEENLNNIDLKNYESINKLSYIQSLERRIRNFTPLYKFNAIEIFKNIKHISLNEIEREAGNEQISFSNIEYSRKYSQNFKLNYLHYIRQLRSSYAIYYFFINQLMDYSQISKSQLRNATEIIIELAIKNFNKNKLLVHCIAFIEMIGFNSQNLRSFLQLLKILYPSITTSTLSPTSSLSSLKKFNSYHEFIENTEKQIFIDYLSFNNNTNNDDDKFMKFPLRQYSAIMKISQTFQSKIWPNLFLNHLCELNDWWKYLILIQYFDIPLTKIKNNSKKFKTKTISEHILCAIFYEPLQEKNKRRSSISRQKSKGKGDNIMVRISLHIVNSFVYKF